MLLLLLHVLYKTIMEDKELFKLRPSSRKLLLLAFIYFHQYAGKLLLIYHCSVELGNLQ